MSQDEHFKFVKALAIDLNRNEIKLSSFPDVVMRVRNALDDPDTSGADLANILSLDPVLTSKVLVLANSAACNPSGVKTDCVATAIGRIGFQKVRTTAISYAVELLHDSEGLEALKKELKETWSRGLRLAAMSEALAQKCTKLDPDSAFLAGLLNRIGVLYIYKKYPEYPNLLQDPEARQGIVDEWAAPIGENIVGNWDFSDEVQATLNPSDDESERVGTDANLADVVTAARASLNGANGELADMPAARRMQLTEDKMPVVMEEFERKLEGLMASVR